jgi:hypothetical protein
MCHYLTSLFFTSVAPLVNKSFVNCILRFMPATAVELDRFMRYTLYGFLAVIKPNVLGRRKLRRHQGFCIK